MTCTLQRLNATYPVFIASDTTGKLRLWVVGPESVVGGVNIELDGRPIGLTMLMFTDGSELVVRGDLIDTFRRLNQHF